MSARQCPVCERTCTGGEECIGPLCGTVPCPACRLKAETAGVSMLLRDGTQTLVDLVAVKELDVDWKGVEKTGEVTLKIVLRVVNVRDVLRITEEEVHQQKQPEGAKA